MQPGSPSKIGWHGRQRSAASDRDSTYTCLVESSKQVRVRHASTLLSEVMVHISFFKEGKQAHKHSPLV